LVTILAWAHCDHVGPVFENDRLRSEITVEGVAAADVGVLLQLRLETYAARGAPEQESRVLDWRLTVISA